MPLEEEFRAVYVEVADKLGCDVVDSPQYRRLFREWVLVGMPEAIDVFILLNARATADDDEYSGSEDDTYLD